MRASFRLVATLAFAERRRLPEILTVTGQAGPQLRLSPAAEAMTIED